jgi:hypothetical protein
MTRGIPLRLLLVALVLFVGGVVVLAIREYLPSTLVWALAAGVLAAVTVLFAVAWQKR